MLQFAILVVFPGLMIFAALSDLFTMTISNRISVALIVAFLPIASFAGLSMHDIGWHFVCGFGVLVLTFTMFAFGWIGGGDAKLAAATALWMGLDLIADYGFYTAVLGGALTLAILALRHVPLPLVASRLGWLARLHDRKSGVPYGIALALAGLLLYPQTGLWHLASMA